MPEIGEIRYWVFIDPDDLTPWVRRLRLVSSTPKGRKLRWDPVDSPGSVTFVSGRHDLPGASAIEAVERFQRDQVFGFFASGDEARERVRLIIAAERLKEQLVAKDNAMPMHAVASTG